MIEYYGSKTAKYVIGAQDYEPDESAVRDGHGDE
jgi:hypothetical protein